MSLHYELILWSSSQEEFTVRIAELINEPSNKYFSHVMNISHCQKSADGQLYVKNLDLLEGGRSKEDIIIVDSVMQKFTKNLTNGIFLPSYMAKSEKQDKWLHFLTPYLKDLAAATSIRQKIKKDFELDSLFENSKQRQAFKKVQTTVYDVQML
jgi:hypothetical protein